MLKGKRLSRNSTTTNRHSTKKTTTFCVFPLTGYLYPLILRFQIRGTWRRQTDRAGDGSRSAWAHEAARVLSKKIEREIPAPRPYFRRSTCCSAECEPPASGRALAFCTITRVQPPFGPGKCDRHAIGFFFADCFHEPLESSRVGFSPDPKATRGASGGRRGVK